MEVASSTAIYHHAHAMYIRACGELVALTIDQENNTNQPTD